MSNTAGQKLWKSFQDVPLLMTTQSQITKTSWNGRGTLLSNLFAENNLTNVEHLKNIFIGSKHSVLAKHLFFILLKFLC